MNKVHCLLVIFGLLLASCTQEFEKTDIDSEILLSLGKTDPPYSLIAETDSIYPCFNFRIATRVRSGPNNFIVSFRHIEEELTCEDSPAPASVEITLGFLVADQYDMEFRLDGNAYTGVYEVFADGTVDFRFTSPAGVRLR
ncbi:MAG: hypothetical protein AAF998_14515 [Bacteroidota bacterium]